MGGYYRVGSVTNVDQMADAVRFIQGQLWVDRLEATVEAHTMPAAQVREATGIPGTSVRTTWLCRDKPSMKEALRQAGVPTAALAAVDSAAEAHEFAERDRLPADPQAAGGRRRPGHDARRLDEPSSTTRCRASAPRAPRRSPSRSSSRATRASTTRSPSTAGSRTTG